MNTTSMSGGTNPMANLFRSVTRDIRLPKFWRDPQIAESVVAKVGDSVNYVHWDKTVEEQSHPSVTSWLPLVRSHVHNLLKVKLPSGGIGNIIEQVHQVLADMHVADEWNGRRLPAMTAHERILYHSLRVMRNGKSDDGSSLRKEIGKLRKMRSTRGQSEWYAKLLLSSMIHGICGDDHERHVLYGSEIAKMQKKAANKNHPQYDSDVTQRNAAVAHEFLRGTEEPELVQTMYREVMTRAGIAIEG